MIITDEMMDKARGCFVNEYPYRSDIRAALEAVAPMLIAQGMREAVDMSGDWFRSTEAYKAIIARAQELDQK